MKIRCCSLLFAACFLATTALAQTPEKSATPRAPGLDRMPAMQLETLRAGLELRFMRMDTNGDGFLSEDEFAVAMPRERRRERANQASRDSQPDAQTRPNRRQGGLPMRGQAFADIDTNGDGQLSKNELLQQVDDLAPFDADGDGALNRSEMRAARQGQASGERKRGKKSPE